jgi:hypothetical protein
MKRITAKTHVDELLAHNPALSRTLIELGLPCQVCGEPYWGTLEELAQKHNVEVSRLVNVLNDKMQETNAKS